MVIMIENIPENGFSIKLAKLDFKNIKCVENGSVETFFDSKHDSQIMGIYGQNASGKTTIINVLAFLRLLLCGAGIKDASQYITAGKNEAWLKAEFKASIPDKTIIFEYEVTISKNTINSWQIKQEKVSAYDLNDQKNKMSFYYDPQEAQGIIGPVSIRSKLNAFLETIPIGISANVSAQLFFLMQREFSAHYNTSFIFSDNMLNLFSSYAQKNEESICDYIILMNSFALNYFFVITDDFVNSHITNDKCIPIILPNQGINADGTMKFFPLNMDKPVLANIQKEEEIDDILLNRINKLLSVLIPDTVLSAHKEYESNNPQKKGIYFTIYSKKGENELPLEYESLGVKKIISLASILSLVYGNSSVVLAIDELDTSINEYLLDVYLSLFKNDGKGQIIFTSNNLHPLELLDKEQCYFTTTKQNNAYTHLKYVKPSNNLKDLYLKLIETGGDEKNTDLFKIISQKAMKNIFNQLFDEDDKKIQD